MPREYRNDREANLHSHALVRGSRTGRLTIQTRQEPNTMKAVKGLCSVVVLVTLFVMGLKALGI